METACRKRIDPHLEPISSSSVTPSAKRAASSSTPISPRVPSYWYLEMVAKQNEINGHTIMPTGCSSRTSPAILRSRDARFRDGQIVSAGAAAAPDAGTSDYDSYPVMALIISECRRLSQCSAVQEQLGAAHRRAGLPGFANGLRG
jgi:hypothetical protein